jgi:hypothetical protein
VRTNVLEMSTHCIIERDRIPIRKFLTDWYCEALQDCFTFDSVDINLDENDPDQSIVLARMGTYKSDDAEIEIAELQIQDRRISFTLSGTDIEHGHQICDQFRHELSEHFIEMFNPESNLLNLLYEAHSTVWIGRLDFDEQQLFHPALTKAIDDLGQSASNPNCEVRSSLEDLRFRFAFHPRNYFLLDSHINVQEKHFRLEPRVGARAESRQWYTSSPTRAEEHIRILKELEIALQQKP